MKKKQKRGLYYLLALVLLALAGYQGFQKNSFYKSAYNEDLPTEQTADDKQGDQDGKEYKTTGDLSLLDVKLPGRLDNQTVHYKAIVVYYNKHYHVPNCVAYELTNTMTSMAVPTGGITRIAATPVATWLRRWTCGGIKPRWSSAS